MDRDPTPRCPTSSDTRSALGADRCLQGLLAGRVICSHEPDLTELRVRADRVALGELALEQPQRERVLDQALDRALERPGAVGRIPARLGDQLLRRVGQLEREPALGEPRAQPRELELDDLAELLARQRLELDDLVDPVQELGPEELAQLPRPSGCSRS